MCRKLVLSSTFWSILYVKVFLIFLAISFRCSTVESRTVLSMVKIWKKGKGLVYYALFFLSFRYSFLESSTSLQCTFMLKLINYFNYLLLRTIHIQYMYCLRKAEKSLGVIRPVRAWIWLQMVGAGYSVYS